MSCILIVFFSKTFDNNFFIFLFIIQCTRILGTLEKVLLSFSVYTNAAKILNTNQPSGTLTAVNGIRFISMTWVILGHGYGFGLSASGMNITMYHRAIVCTLE